MKRPALRAGRLAGILLLPLAAAAANAPQITLFPTTVLEEIRHTGTVAQQMESGLQAIIARLDQQRQLYADSKCEGAEDDPGCAQLGQQLGESYMEMLEVMETNLPEMERAVEATRASLERRLRRELGQKMTPWQLQETLLGTATDGVAEARRPTLRGRSGMRLSTRFDQYYRLVANGSSKRDASLTVIAADIYLDMEETSALIARTRDEIGRATLMQKLNHSFGAITPEMQEVVAGVKTILFGDPVGDAPLPAPPTVTTPEGYRSPLAL